MNRNLPQILVKEDHGPQLIHRFEPFYRSRTPEMKGCLGPLQESPCALLKTHAVGLSPILPPKGPEAFYQDNCTWGKGEDQIFQELLGTGSELMLIPQDPKHHDGPSVRVRTNGGDQWSFGKGLTHSGSNRSPDISCSYFPSSRMRHWQNPHTDSLTCSYYVWKGPNGRH